MHNIIYHMYVYNIIYLKKKIYIYIYTLILQRPLIIVQEKGIFFRKHLFEMKSCFLHVSDVHSEVRWSYGNQINVPHCQLATHCCRCRFNFGWLKVQEQDFQSIGSRLCVWCHGFNLPRFDFWLVFAILFIIYIYNIIYIKYDIYHIYLW